jgi:hypothetical protein
MMGAAEQNPVVDVGSTRWMRGGSPFVDMVGLAPRRRTIAARPDAPPVSSGKRPILGRTEQSPGFAVMEDLSAVAEDRRRDGGVAAESLDRGLRERFVEAVDPADAPARLEVCEPDVHIHRGRGSCQARQFRRRGSTGDEIGGSVCHLLGCGAHVCGEHLRHALVFGFRGLRRVAGLRGLRAG